MWRPIGIGAVCRAPVNSSETPRGVDIRPGSGARMGEAAAKGGWRLRQPGWRDISAGAYVSRWPQWGQSRSDMVRYLSSGDSSGDRASVNGIASPHFAHSTTRYHFPNRVLLAMCHRVNSLNTYHHLRSNPLHRAGADAVAGGNFVHTFVALR
jgi:hypothetical protein